MYPTTQLAPGSTNSSAVQQLQQYLVSQGFMTQAQMNTGIGIYGPATTAAVNALQNSLVAQGKLTSSQVATGPGIFGPQTLSALSSSGSSVPTNVPAGTTVQMPTTPTPTPIAPSNVPAGTTVQQPTPTPAPSVPSSTPYNVPAGVTVPQTSVPTNVPAGVTVPAPANTNPITNIKPDNTNSWNLSSWTSTGTGWGQQPILTVNGQQYKFNTPQEYQAALTQLKGQGMTGNLDTFISQFNGVNFTPAAPTQVPAPSNVPAGVTVPNPTPTPTPTPATPTPIAPTNVPAGTTTSSLPAGADRVYSDAGGKYWAWNTSTNTMTEITKQAFDSKPANIFTGTFSETDPSADYGAFGKNNWNSTIVKLPTTNAPVAPSNVPAGVTVPNTTPTAASTPTPTPSVIPTNVPANATVPVPATPSVPTNVPTGATTNTLPTGTDRVYSDSGGHYWAWNVASNTMNEITKEAFDNKPTSIYTGSFQDPTPWADTGQFGKQNWNSTVVRLPQSTSSTPTVPANIPTNVPAGTTVQNDAAPANVPAGTTIGSTPVTSPTTPVITPISSDPNTLTIPASGTTPGLSGTTPTTVGNSPANTLTLPSLGTTNGNTTTPTTGSTATTPTSSTTTGTSTGGLNSTLSTNNPTPSPFMPPVPSTTMTGLEGAVTAGLQKSADEIANDKAIVDAQARLAELTQAQQRGIYGVESQPIATPFITGQSAAIAKLSGIMQQGQSNTIQTLQQKAALLQAQRQTALDVSKFALERADKINSDALAKDKERYITLSDGSTLYDKTTGKIVANNPSDFSPNQQTTNTFGELSSADKTKGVNWIMQQLATGAPGVTQDDLSKFQTDRAFQAYILSLIP